MSTEQMTGMSLAQKRELLARMLREKAAAPKKYPLSFAQQRLWFLDQLEPGSHKYNIHVAVRLTGTLDVDALSRTLDEIVRRHEVLRTTFFFEGGEPVQIISPARTLGLESEDLCGVPVEEREREATRIAGEERRTPFDLAKGPLMRARLLKLSEAEHIVLLTMHHIVTDGWSSGVLIKEVAALYEAFSKGEPSPLPELQIQYADYSAWQRQRLQGEVLDQQLSYWKKQLGGELPVLELPTDRPRAAMPSHRGAHHTFRLDQTLTDGLRELSRREGCTLFMTLLAAFQLLLSRYSGQQDIIVGTPIAGRTRAELEPLIGFFINTLALRTDLSGEPTFAELLGRVREVTLGAYAHQEVPFEKLVEELRPERDTSRQPLFQVMFAMQNTGSVGGGGWARLPGLELSAAATGAGASSKFDLMLTVAEKSGELATTFEYATDLFDQESIERMASHFAALLEGVVKSADTPSRRLPLMDEPERQWNLRVCNQTAADYERDSTIHDLFARQAAATPDAVALATDTAELTYAELERRSNALARYLRSLGVGPETLVGVMAQRSAELIVALLGVLKAGGAYLPLEPDYPAERISFMLAEARPAVIIGSEAALAALPAHTTPTLSFEQWRGEQETSADDAADGAADVPPATSVTPDALAYVIYTSGSTGRPKGVMATHRGVVRLVRSPSYVALSAQETLLQYAPVSFDASTFEVWGALLNGARLAVMAPGQASLAELAAALRRHRVSVLWLTAGLFAQMAAAEGEALREVGQVLAGGDVLPSGEVARHLAGGGRVLVNGYGPTEVTTFACCERLVEWGGEAVPIGRPIQNTTAYVVERGEMAGEVAPTGVAGELYLGGDGVARGYLGRAALTAERFVPDPYSRVAGGRLYRSGDLVRRLPDGRLEFLGRLDAQVKVRGYRIEPGEVEAALCAHDRVRAAAVVARGEGAGGKRLVGYYVCEAGGEVEAGELREHLRGRLPEYMVPAVLMALAELPLTGNGKVDRRALPEPSVGGGGGEGYVGPRTAVEEVLSGVYGRVLGMEAVGVRDNFFELGGHSLLATQVISRVREVFGVELPLRTLFERPTVEGLAGAVDEALRAGVSMAAPPLLRRDGEAPAPLSFAQQRLWFLDQLEPGNAFYNVPLAVKLTGALNVEAFERTLDEIVRRHEVLRTSFAVKGTQPVQVISPARSIGLELIDLRGLPEAERAAEARRLGGKEARTPFDLSVGPLLRAKLLKLSDEEHVVLLTMHHIVSDGWSLGVLVKEVAALYEAFSRGEESPLPELAIQYADYAAWQREWLQGEVLEAQVSYWKKQLEELPVLELPTDRPRPPAQSFRGAQLSLHIPEETLRGLKELSRREGCTLFMTLLAAFQLLLSRYSGQEDIIVGTPIAGRTRAEAEGLIGFFVNTLALRTDLSGDPTFVELMKRVREVTLGAYAHQEVPFEKLVEELRPERDTSRQPLFQVMFAMQNAPTGGGGARLAGLELTPASSGAGATSKFDLMLTVTERGGELAASFEYATDLFDQESIERMASHLKTLLTGVVSAAPGTPVWRLPLMCEEERLRVVSEWNRTQRDYDRSATLHGFFEQQAAATPDAVAVSFEGERLTYRELNEHANRLAHHLASLGVGTESRVGVLLTRRPELLVSLLAVMKAGGCYVPLDPAYPRERLSFMLEDASASVLVTAGSLRGLLPAHGASVVNLEAWRQETTTYSADNPSCAAGPQNLAYLIYTSGSTGRPKAVAIEHRSAATLLHWAKESFTPEELSGVLASTSVCFDLSVFELFVPLSCGGKVILAENALALPGLPAASEVTLVNTVPSAMAELIRQKSVPPGVKVVNLAGEALKRSLVDGVYGASAVERVLNLYGPSEDTTYSTFTQVARDEAGEPTIGKPLANTRVYVVDAHMRPVPVGVPGELLIGGEGLARGYLGRPALTAERFVPDPFGGQEGERLYRTGDLVRFLPDGRLEFRGRLDHQVKVRGFRIELGEIEAALLKHASVREAVAVVREAKTGDKRLVAYCVAVEGSSVGVGELREHLRGRLPEYMVPTAFVALERLPLTPNGKLDRRALPEPGTGGEEYVAPRNEIEAALAEMWVELLGVERIGVNDNFFELGGHSLLATQVVSRVREAFRVELPLVGIFQTPTVAGLAEAVAVCREQQQGTEQPSIKRVEHDREEALLARLDEMSAEDIEALLSDMSTVE